MRFRIVRPEDGHPGFVSTPSSGPRSFAWDSSDSPVARILLGRNEVSLFPSSVRSNSFPGGLIGRFPSILQDFLCSVTFKREDALFVFPLVRAWEDSFFPEAVLSFVDLDRVLGDRVAESAHLSSARLQSHALAPPLDVLARRTGSDIPPWTSRSLDIDSSACCAPRILAFGDVPFLIVNDGARTRHNSGLTLGPPSDELRTSSSPASAACRSSPGHAFLMRDGNPPGRHL